MTKLTDVLKPLPQDFIVEVEVGKTIVKTPGALAWQCHQAALAWMYEAEFGRAITGLDFGTFFMNPKSILDKIVAKGMRVFPSATGQVYFAPGTVLIFIKDRVPEHTCILKANDIIVGYNQTDWFKTPGVASGFSMHSTADLKWSGGVVTRHNHKYVLWAIVERLALDEVRKHVVGLATTI